MRQFNNTVILTNKNPEAFLNFTFDATDYVLIIPDISGYTNRISSGLLYINGIDISEYSSANPLDISCYGVRLDASHNIASFHIYTDVNYDFDVSLNFKLYTDYSWSSDSPVNGISIKNRPFILDVQDINNYNNDDLIVDDQASYLIMRTNPKFTGNIKIVVDSSNKLYLDTFKVSSLLSNQTYRKRAISGNGVLSNDIRNIFSTLLNTGDMYTVSKTDTLDIDTPKTEFKDQYNTTYNYGARLLLDELYPEDNALLAPLWINSKIPDYFAVFKMPGVYNDETYREEEEVFENLASKYLEQSKIIKSWNLKLGSPIGNYLYTHLKDLLKIQSPVFLSLSTDINSADGIYDPNTWYGIAVQEGVLAGKSETPYFFNKKLNNFTDLNAFISTGFERNNLLCPNLLNIEYVFDDNDVSLYQMNRYYGLYLTENILYTIAYYADTSNGNISILSLDGKDSSVFMNSSIFDADGSIVSEYENRIFVLNDGDNLIRFKNVNEINDSAFNIYASKPHKNLFNTVAEKIETNSFITITLNSTLEAGEHLRIINKTTNKIWEVYGVDATRYGCESYCSLSQNIGFPDLYRTRFNVNGNIQYQAEQIGAAFERFSEYNGTDFHVGRVGLNWVSIVLNDDAVDTDEWVFQRITSSTLNNMSDPSSGFNNAGKFDDITFFGRFTPIREHFETVTYDSSFGPIDFEYYGDRLSLFLNLFNGGTNYYYSFDSSKNITDKFEEPTLYQGTDSWYKKIIDFDVSDNSYQYVKDPVGGEDKVIILTEYEIAMVGNTINTYSIIPINISLMGINPVKDIDYAVYDNQNLGYQSEYDYVREDDAQTYELSIDACSNYNLDLRGSYVIKSGNGIITQKSVPRNYDVSTAFNTFDGSAYFTTNTATVVTYAFLDGSFNNFSIPGVSFSSENVNDYYIDKLSLKYGLVIPYVSKWVGLGNDCRNNPLLLKLDNPSTNYTISEDHFSDEISYPSFKYLSPGTRAWESYTFYDINDVVNDNSTYRTFKEMMLEYPYVDYFSKLIYSNNNVQGNKTRSSLVYYNSFKNAIDVVITGLKLSLKINDIAKSLIDLKTYDRFRFSLISTASKNKNTKHPIEVIINENTRTILMIWYQGNDELNYTMRHSGYLPGKSLLDASGHGFVTSTDPSLSYYSFIKTPFIVNNATFSKTLKNIYDVQDTYDSSIVRPYLQFNKGVNNYNSIWSAFSSNNRVIDNLFFSTTSYNTFNQSVDYVYAPTMKAYNNYTANYGYHYNSNENLYENNTTELETLQYLLSPTFSNVMYYVMKGDYTYTSLNYGNTSLMNISVSPTKEINGVKAYHGWYKPKFVNILEFNSNETRDLINTVGRGFISSNTYLRKYNDIPQLWFNKLVTQISDQDITEGNAISYDSFNVFKSLWDGAYYLKDNAYVHGYNCPDELPSFFGSKLPKFPDSLVLNNWNSNTATYTETTSEVVVTYNLTQAVLSYFRSNLDFIYNWAGLTSADNILNNYILNTVLTYYNFRQSKLGLDFYYKTYDSQRLHYNYDSMFKLDNKQNVNAQLLYLNNEYIYRIIIPKTGDFSYYMTVTLYET